MGQKTHPHGLRVGIHRKWNSTWFAQGQEYTEILAHQRHVEELLRNGFQNYAYTKSSGATRLSVVEVRLFKQGMRNLLIFVLFYKFRTKRTRTSFTMKVSTPRRSTLAGLAQQSVKEAFTKESAFFK